MFISVCNIYCNILININQRWKEYKNIVLK